MERKVRAFLNENLNWNALRESSSSSSPTTPKCRLPTLPSSFQDTISSFPTSIYFVVNSGQSPGQTQIQSALEELRKLDAGSAKVGEHNLDVVVLLLNSLQTPNKSPSPPHTRFLRVESPPPIPPPRSSRTLKMYEASGAPTLPPPSAYSVAWKDLVYHHPGLDPFLALCGLHDALSLLHSVEQS